MCPLMNKPHSLATESSVLAISSDVGVGAVGLSIARYVFASERLPAVYLPTVFYAARPGLGRVVRHVMPAECLDEALNALLDDGLLDHIDGVMTGFFACPEQIAVVCRFIDRFRAQRPDVKLLVDPIMGDFGTGQYVGEDVARPLITDLVPRGDIITPNLFEFLLMAGQTPQADDCLMVRTNKTRDWTSCLAAISPQIENAVVTSAFIQEVATGTGEGKVVQTILIENGSVQRFESCFFDNVPNGTGDVFAAILLCQLVRGKSLQSGVEHAVTRLEKIADKTQQSMTIEPYLLF